MPGLALVWPGQGGDPLCTQVRLGPLAVVASVGSHAGPSPGNSWGGLHTGSLETWGPESSGQDAEFEPLVDGQLRGPCLSRDLRAPWGQSWATPPCTVTAALGRFLVERTGQKTSRSWRPYLHNAFVDSLDDLVKTSDTRWLGRGLRARDSGSASRAFAGLKPGEAVFAKP